MENEFPAIRVRTRRPVTERTLPDGEATGDNVVPFRALSQEFEPTAAGQATEVGYKRPPVASRFKKGQSGNPRGRPKTSKNTRTLAREKLAEKHVIHINGRPKTVEMREAMIMALTKKSMSGDIKAFKMMHDLAGEPVGVAEAGDDAVQAHALSHRDLDILSFVYDEKLREYGLADGHRQELLAMLGLSSTEADRDGEPGVAA